MSPRQAVRSWALLGLGLKEDSSKPQTHRGSSIPRLQLERNLVLCLEVMCFMAFEMCAKALVCHVRSPAWLCKRTGILLCRYSCVRWKGMSKLMRNRLTLY